MLISSDSDDDYAFAPTSTAEKSNKHSKIAPKPNPDLAIIHAEISLMPEDFGSKVDKGNASGKWVVLYGPCKVVKNLVLELSSSEGEQPPPKRSKLSLKGEPPQSQVHLLTFRSVNL